MRILVTGGAGFVGSNIANSLGESKDNDIVALDDLSLGVPSNLSANVRFVKGSVMDPLLLQELCKDCDFVFHDAAKSSSPMFKENPSHGVDVNAIGFMNVMESAKKNNVRKVIYASSSSLYNGSSMPFNEHQFVSPRSFYEASFYCREVLARSYYLEWGVKSIGLRYFSVYGPNEGHKGKFANNITQFIWDVMAGKRPIVYGDGTQTRDFTHVSDVVNANVLAMDSGIDYGIYNVGTGVQTSFTRVVKAISEGLGSDISPIYMANPIKNYVQDTLADTTLARTSLGFEAKCRLEEGIKRAIAYWRNERAPVIPAS
jgi:UDP-glucose 4-epimerase